MEKKWIESFTEWTRTSSFLLLLFRAYFLLDFFRFFFLHRDDFLHRLGNWDRWLLQRRQRRRLWFWNRHVSAYINIYFVSLKCRFYVAIHSCILPFKNKNQIKKNQLILYHLYTSLNSPRMIDRLLLNKSKSFDRASFLQWCIELF